MTLRDAPGGTSLSSLRYPCSQLAQSPRWLGSALLSTPVVELGGAGPLPLVGPINCTIPS
jgi:hypothetical protein